MLYVEYAWWCRGGARPSASPAGEGTGGSIGVKAMTPPQALQAHSDALTGFEQSEILNHQEIYFLGVDSKKIEGLPHSSDFNHG